jgi:hypothetical protein
MDVSYSSGGGSIPLSGTEHQTLSQIYVVLNKKGSLVQNPNRSRVNLENAALVAGIGLVILLVLDVLTLAFAGGLYTLFRVAVEGTLVFLAYYSEAYDRFLSPNLKSRSTFGR